MAKKILIASGKGGTGRTFFTSNIGVALADKGYKVALVDLDLSLKNLDIYLGLESKVVFNILDVLNGLCRVRQGLVRDKRFDHLYILAGAYFRDEKNIDEKDLIKLYNILDSQFDYIIIDSFSGDSSYIKLATTNVDMCILTIEANIPSIRDGEILATYLKDVGVKNLKYVLNKANFELIERKLTPSVLEISNSLGLDSLGIIQYDENILISTNYGQPIYLEKESYISTNIDNMAKKIIDELNE